MSEKVITCAMCGLRFTQGKQVCDNCPMHVGCHLVCCPQCGHSVPRESKIVYWLRWLLGIRS